MNQRSDKGHRRNKSHWINRMGEINRAHKFLLFSIGALLFTVGCQKSGNLNDGALSQASVSCGSQKVSVDPSTLKINGVSGAQPGQVVSYSLNKNMNCATDQSVSWKTLSPGSSPEVSQKKSQLTSVYNKPGTYVVTAQIQSADTLVPTEVSYKTVVTDGLAVTGPDVGNVGDMNSFTLVVPLGTSVESGTWDFGDGSTGSGNTTLTHAYAQAGTYTVTVTASLFNGNTSIVTHTIQILDQSGTNDCLSQLAISGPSTGEVGTPVSFSAYIPACLTWDIRAVNWDFGDQSPYGTDQTVSHTYQAENTYHVALALYTGSSASPFAVLYHDIVISAATTDPDPGTGTDPTDPNACSVLGQQRQIDGDLYSEDKSCGVGGTETDSYRDIITQTCTLNGEAKDWVETSRTKKLVNAGTCESQSCEIPATALSGVDAITSGLQLINGKYYLPDGISKTFYSSTTPASSCQTVATTRTCHNGVLDGSTDYSYLSCRSGCDGFGVDGTVQTGVVTGEISVPVTCSFGETGIVSIFNQISDKKCDNGTIVVSNTRQGDVKTAGQCPTYSWVATDGYSQCSADCGGEQTQVFECRDNNGNVAPDDHCTGEPPVVTRVCDGNPDAVKRTETSTSTEEGGSSQMCPANQIGIEISQRTVTETKTYACIDHQVALASDTTSYGPWDTEKYCRDYVPHRCSQDSLAPSQATGRYQWMQKCQGKVPAIKEFLQAFSDFEIKSKNGQKALWYHGHELYPTFMNRKSSRHGCNHEVPWIAPTNPHSSCDHVPSSVYVAAVCTASCALPEEQILSGPGGFKKLQYLSFLSNWQQKVQYVATLAQRQTLHSQKVSETPVDVWITELIDTDHDMLTFTMKSGGVLTVTMNHAILAADGTMKLAENFKVGDDLVRDGGVRDPIVSIDKSVYHGKLYNLFVKSTDLRSNVVITNGYLNGTAYFQNEGAEFMNRELFRANLVHGVFAK